MFLTQSDVKTLKRIRRYIEDTQVHPIAVTEIIAQFGMKESKLTKGFKLLFKIGIYEYYLQRSMDQAKAMLQQGAQVKEVAIVFGYSTTGSFSRAFKKIHDAPPSTFKVQ